MTTVEVLRPTAWQDQALLKQAQGALVTEATLPSGFKVPSAPQGQAWIVENETIRLQPTPERFEKRKD